MYFITGPLVGIFKWTYILQQDSSQSFIFGYEGTGTQEEDKHYVKNGLFGISDRGYVLTRPRMPAMKILEKLRPTTFDRAPLFQGLIFNPSDAIQIKRGTMTTIDVHLSACTRMICIYILFVFLILVFVYFNIKL